MDALQIFLSVQCLLAKGVAFLVLHNTESKCAVVSVLLLIGCLVKLSMCYGLCSQCLSMFAIPEAITHSQHPVFLILAFMHFVHVSILLCI